jgi:hypothetical protein
VRLAPGLATQVVFLSPLSVTGGLMLLFSQIFGWIFLPMIDLPSLSGWNRPLERAQARVVSVERTSTRVNKRRVTAVAFEHGPHRGVSYTTDPRGLASGAVVDIEHPAGKPERARIVGMGRRAFPAWALVPLMPVVLAALVLLAIGVGVGLRRVGLLRRGELGKGELLERTPTNTRINQRRVHRHRYRFTTTDGRTGEVIARSHHDLPANGDVIYDPETLNAVVLDAMPGRPRLASHDELAATRPRLALAAALAPVAGVLGWIAAFAIFAR